ncbi:Ldh family oxidoreductase [Sulfitobacter sp.]|jgi:(2R)-3-sulfolactate dehydrogenase (NADP+)|uniref:Ldh family oxidoreductase n=1 Tax=Sulfitobacter sp. TaxID=1903071 RepID=UPI000C4297D4|nr:sulfolactate dehydrogenase [Roseobacter sp.]MBV47894.1 sulfolactate dehydrogenase [Roseobacter sp.]|tara:strand:- start:7503 stop:8516 length:1014 start_codon:yes stop_codon:yes gene_type:complete
MEHSLSLDDVEALAFETLAAAGAARPAARAVARSTRLAERDGIRSHGLLYLPIYAEHLMCGKVSASATPSVTTPRSGLVHVDADHGFAHTAIDAGWDKLVEAAQNNGIAAMSVKNSYNCGVLGHHAERLATDGLIGLCFTHAPASIAPPGGKLPVVGTNPFSIAVPGEKGEALLVIDQSASAIAKSEILLRSREGVPIEPGWALDAQGNETLDADAALAGSMLPSGGYKGFGVGLLVEILAAALTGANLSTEASPFSGPNGGPPGTGQFFIAIDPAGSGEAGFGGAMARLAASITDQPGARLPGKRRADNRARIEAEGVKVSDDLLARIKTIAASPS